MKVCEYSRSEIIVHSENEYLSSLIIPRKLEIKLFDIYDIRFILKHIEFSDRIIIFTPTKDGSLKSVFHIRNSHVELFTHIECELVITNNNRVICIDWSSSDPN